MGAAASVTEQHGLHLTTDARRESRHTPCPREVASVNSQSARRLVLAEVAGIVKLAATSCVGDKTRFTRRNIESARKAPTNSFTAWSKAVPQPVTLKGAICGARATECLPPEFTPDLPGEGIDEPQHSGPVGSIASPLSNKLGARLCPSLLRTRSSVRFTTGFLHLPTLPKLPKKRP